MKQSNHFSELRALLLDLQKNMRELVPLIDEMQAFKAGIDADILQRLQDIDSLSSRIVLVVAQNFCENCGATPAWVREAQFAGKTLFCDKCAREQPEFEVVEKYASYFWKELKPIKK